MSVFNETEPPERTLQLRRTDGAILNYRLRRCGRPHAPVLVMIHGLASNLTRWSEFVANTSLRETWDLLRIDLRGHGRSQWRGKITRAVWCEDLAAVLRAEGYTQAVLAGHSLGAQVAIEFAHRYRERVAGMILIDPVFPQALGGKLAVARRVRRLIWVTVRLAWLLNCLGLRRRGFPERDLRELDEATRRVLASDNSTDIARLYSNPLADLPYISVANYLQDLFEVTRPLLPCVESTQPLLVLLSQGPSVSKSSTTEYLIGQLGRPDVIRIDADHWLLTERPNEAREAIDGWCSSICSAVRGAS